MPQVSGIRKNTTWSAPASLIRIDLRMCDQSYLTTIRSTILPLTGHQRPTSPTEQQHPSTSGVVAITSCSNLQHIQDVNWVNLPWCLHATSATGKTTVSQIAHPNYSGPALSY